LVYIVVTIYRVTVVERGCDMIYRSQSKSKGRTAKFVAVKGRGHGHISRSWNGSKGGDMEWYCPTARGHVVKEKF
jgi:hypothetical protein